MSVYAYNNSTAESSSGDLNQVMNAIEATLNELDGDVKKLTGSWEGSEQEQYHGIQQKWSGNANHLKEILGQVRASLDENTQSVAETRSRVSNALQNQ
ncbi:WXG100 family type VII secretion target [Corynebacterium heidelbergense]|uniref:ESAT-6-like protein n=1 Tax=Corynebacterium heidelbergense TaxID=2055947 RepID=A0A364V4H4_9CORY|nr:WXG100 family type VII secretion target [Corynebacterium heidelbergense]RAV31521.1 WXG100 family type VII secretion target [Corynebacterium heidelbergense]